METSFKEIKTCIVCALDCEAGPLIRHFGLKAEGGGGDFPIYGNQSTSLVVTGVGKEKVEAGTVLLGERRKASHPLIWVNIGIAGHPIRRIGEAVVAGKVLDQASGEVHYPHLAFRPTLPVDPLVTVNSPFKFRDLSPNTEEALYDMEAAGFYPAALRYSSSELVHCIKIVSDNGKNPSSEIRPARVRDWVAGALPEIEGVIRGLGDLVAKRSPEAPDAVLMDKVLARWHFSEYQRIELGKLLGRVHALGLEGELKIKGLDEFLNSRGFLVYLKSLLEGSVSVG